MVRWHRGLLGARSGAVVFTTLLLTGLGAGLLAEAREAAAGTERDQELDAVQRGRQLVLSHACGDCHGGFANPAGVGWLAGAMAGPDGQPVGQPVGQYITFPRNLTPDDETGIGRYTERQIFNALRYGLRPSKTPDVEITSTVPGEGNFPAEPSYLAPSMPWPAWRHMTDQELRDIAAYLKRGLRPVQNSVPDSEAPAGGWAAEVVPARIGAYPATPFPTDKEELRDPSRRDQVLRGRQLVIETGCGDCHGGAANPSAPGWMAGLGGHGDGEPVAVFAIEFPIGPFKTRPRNLTPDNTTGMGRFTERQIFNALRYGLRPGETPDVEITSTVPGQGNHPANPKYLAPPMPWPAWRHLPDEDIWAIAAYLKHGVKPVRNRVADSDGPPDFWAGDYAPEKIGAYPPPPFPAARERVPPVGNE